MKNLIFTILFFLFVKFSYANTAYISSDGVGDGYDIERPANLSELNRILTDPNIDNITLKAGTYYQTDTLFISQGVNPVKVSGEGNVIITSDYHNGSGGSSGFIVARSNISFANINFNNTRYCFRFKNYTAENVSIEHIRAHNTMSCVEFDSGILANVSNIKINELTSIAYYKAGIRINGDTPKNITISNSRIDGSTLNLDSKKDCHVAGISVSGSTKNINIHDVSISNNIGGSSNCGTYQQGDGIVVNSEVSGLSIKNVLVSNSRDADFDIKSQHTNLEQIISLSGANNRHNLKLWYSNYSCRDCYIKASKANSIQAIGSKIEFIDSVFEVSDILKVCDLRDRRGIMGSVRFSNTRQLDVQNLTAINDFIPDCI
ncbi:exported hypothetical protein [Pseudoalteromonas sp. 3J6]|uniref:hypothetical protein n=1 Tax=Pseudoalteromonas sp. 3J6 TaxID=649161 RepID=UPI001754F89D|nr:hypothetical protein [Pseudoalteromonas sp. 3J6]CAD2223183.1 exported hypothetical protein [Pseudoalteromonas sp. 3J6]